MTITVAFANSANLFGPGVGVTLSSTFIGPLPTGTTWVVDTAAGATPLVLAVQDSFAINSNPAFVVPFGTIDQELSSINPEAFQTGIPLTEGAAVNLTLQLNVPGSGTVDTGTATAVWSNIAGLYALTILRGPSGGSSPLLAQILAAVQQTYVNSA